jgi:hypothetical protein
MSEYGFAVSVSAKQYAKDPEGVMWCARRLLRRNYEQSMAVMLVRGDEAPTVEPSLCMGIENDDGEIPICWYIDETGEYGAPGVVIGPLLEASNG